MCIARLLSGRCINYCSTSETYLRQTVYDHMNNLRMHEWGGALHLTCRLWCFDMTWHMCGSSVRTTCLQLATDVIKRSVHKHKLGVGYIWQIKHGGTLGELYGTSRHVMECYVQAQDARSWSLHVRRGRLGLVQAGCVRSVSKRPGANLSISERQVVIMSHVWGARLVAWCAGGPEPLLFDASWRV